MGNGFRRRSIMVSGKQAAVQRAFVNSACSFGYKIGNGIGSALLGLILEIGGYVGTAAVQTESALTSIKICFVWIPIAVYVCGLVIMKFYHLDKEFAGIIEDLKKRTQK